MAKKALCVGINYKGTSSALNGCINDANDWANLLVSHFDFPKPDVKLLLETQATKVNIIAGLKALLAGAKSGDVLVFQNSSHGTYVVDKGSDEPDRYDEAICPYDFKRNLILDDEMREIFSGLPARVRLTVLLDSCHSGTGTRVVFNPTVGYRKERFMEPSAFGGKELENPQKAKVAGKLPQSRDEGDPAQRLQVHGVLVRRADRQHLQRRDDLLRHRHHQEGELQDHLR